ncbi:unnamed protein product [Fusarium venenatum]|uniref:Zn(2)-C6 fungal-type domain-containing protein n=1 Tax=Fusarium venenatum TaxID=56646 RepID=A0A2L2SZV3_9HYPO|nr:uncharacterized protein FVRRES_00224 [Fusarium venenatum]KAH7006515.1 hypothetical protein EDB82DRAFT_438789 [Fusarium venenatum]CEI63712.1 unnamed protein product [Fusarium venenatum]
MVGVPAKAGGCLTCPRRKKGCDKKKPFCQRCISAGYVCEGYDHPHIWINTTSKKLATYTKAHNPIRTAAESGSITLCDSLVRSARDTKYIGLFLSAYLPNGRMLSSTTSQLSPVGWVRYHEYLSGSEKSLQFITLAHGLAALAERDDNQQLRAKAFEAYRAGLRETAMAIRDPKRATSNGLIAAVRLYRFYEIRYGAKGVVSSGPKQQIDSYKAHSDGEMAIFQAKGPCGYWEGPARHLLADSRVVSYINCVTDRKRSFFSEEDWMLLPWRNRKKSPLDLLTDVLVQIPGLLQDLDLLRDLDPNEVETYEATEKLVRHCLQLEQILVRWKDIMPDAFYLLDSTVVGRQELPSLQTDEDIAVLQPSFLYWSCCIILYTTMHFARQHSNVPEILAREAQVPFPHPGEGQFEHPRNPTLYAHKILYAIPLCHQSQCGSYAVLASTFPLGIAIRYLTASPYFPHTGEHQPVILETSFMERFMAQAYMASYPSIFLANLNHVEATDPKADSLLGWDGIVRQARKWWFGTRDVG